MFLSFIVCEAQAPSVSATMESYIVNIGDEIKLNIEANYTGDVKMQWPTLEIQADSVEVEVLEYGKLDTLVAEGEAKKVKQQIKLMAFDGGGFRIARWNFPIPITIIRSMQNENTDH